MTTPIGCTLYVDGNRVADGTPGDPDQAPTALSGLSVTWGRSTTVDQVEPSTCTFDLMDPPGAGSFLDLLYTGARVDVTASGIAAAAPGTPVNADPGFESGTPGSTVPGSFVLTNAGATLVYTRAAAAAGVQSALWAQATWQAADVVKVYPGPLSSDPTAWDHLQTVQPGEDWSVTATVRAAAGSVVLLAIWLYSKPDGTTLGSWIGAAEHPATGDWQTLTTGFTATPEQAGTWAGLQMTVWYTKWTAATGTWNDAAGTWKQLTDVYLDDVAILPPATEGGNILREVAVFSGRVTDLDAGWDNGPGTVVCSVTAADFTADLAQRDVGAPAWYVETLATRFDNILYGAGLHSAIRYTIAPTLANWLVTYMDVDRQQCWPLLADLATSVDGVLWSATHRTTGPYLWLADPRVQSALYVLYVGDDGLVHVGPTAAADAAIQLDACDVLLEPVVWKQAVSDVTTRVAVTWQEQAVDDDGEPTTPTERTYTLIDAALEARLGTRRAAVSTVLVSEADATSIAQLLLGRLHLASWRVGGLTWLTDPDDLDPDRAGRVLDLLDGTRRLGAAVLLTNLPPWAPNGGGTLPLLLQGGTYTFDDGRWALNLTTSSAAAQGSSLPWTDLDPAYAWNEVAPDVAWSDLAGVA
jgi:hypothetical protein